MGGKYRSVIKVQGDKPFWEGWWYGPYDVIGEEVVAVKSSEVEVHPG